MPRFLRTFDTGPVAAIWNTPSASMPLVSGTSNVIPYTTMLYDPYGMVVSGTNFRAIVPFAGFYRVDMGVGVNGVVNYTDAFPLIVVQGSVAARGARARQYSVIWTLSTIVLCSEGDYIQPYAYINSLSAGATTKSDQGVFSVRLLRRTG